VQARLQGAQGNIHNLGELRKAVVLDVVQGQINRIDQELRIQMTRMAQIQAEVDLLRANLKRLAGD